MWLEVTNKNALLITDIHTYNRLHTYYSSCYKIMSYETYVRKSYFTTQQLFLESINYDKDLTATYIYRELKRTHSYILAKLLSICIISTQFIIRLTA